MLLLMRDIDGLVCLTLWGRIRTGSRGAEHLNVLSDKKGFFLTIVSLLVCHASLWSPVYTQLSCQQFCKTDKV